MTREEAINKLHGLIYGVVDRQRIDDTCREVIDYLKEQEPVEPIRKVIGYGWRYFCGKCGKSIVSQQHFCQECGQAVKWNG